MTLELKLTQADIDAAVEWDRRGISAEVSYNCPVAQALKRTFPKATRVFAGYWDVLVEGKKFSRTFEGPDVGAITRLDTPSWPSLKPRTITLTELAR